ncbi:MAG: hypothetical protein AAFO68_06430 [Pseudomonadota bacterium]
MTLVSFFLTAIVTLALSYALCALLTKSDVTDAPDGIRKHQAAPVSRLGGIGIALSTLIGGLAWVAWSLILAGDAAPLAETRWMFTHWTVCVFVGAAFLIGLLDDLGILGTVPKLLGLLLSALLVCSFGLFPPELSSPWASLTLMPVLVIGSAMWLLVFTNAANFMDGSNGLSIGCLAIKLIGLAIIGAQHGALSLNAWWIGIVAAIGGFLIHNLRGQLYAGDAGALGLGALFASLALVSGLNVWTVATLALPFLIDVLLTLIWRAKHGRNWLEAHLDHAYQRAIASGWSHIEIAVLYWGLTITAAAMAWIAAQAGGAAPFIVFWALLIAGIGIWITHRRATKALDLRR